MTDQTPVPTPGNSNRITSMLQDLATQKAGAPVPPPAGEARPQGGPPNLPGAAPMPARPVAPMPTPQVSIPKPPVIPQAPKPAPVAPTTQPAPTAASGKPTYTSELRTMSADIGNIKIGQAPAAVPMTPVPPSTPRSTPSANAPAPQITIPPASSGGARKALYGIGIVGILALVVYGIVFLMSGNGEQEVVASPSPSVSTSATPFVKNLTSYFGNPKQTIDLNGSGTGKDDFQNGLVGTQPVAKQATRIAVTHEKSASTLETFFVDIGSPLPPALISALGTEWAVLVCGQTEQYDQSTGILISNPTTVTRLVIISELSDVSSANQSLQLWENIGLASDNGDLLQYDFSKKITQTFSSGTYRQIPVKYWNFPYADHSIDYAVVMGSNNKNYLVIAGSREAMFFAIDKLMQ